MVSDTHPIKLSATQYFKVDASIEAMPSVSFHLPINRIQSYIR